MISLEVKSVSNTNLLAIALPLEKRQVTVYENKIFNARPKNAMIIPVPEPASVRFHDFSGAGTSFFELLSKYFSQQLMSFCNSASGEKSRDRTLEVIKIGDYQVSLANSLDELEAVDKNVFILSRGAKRMLSDYPSDWGFIVFGLSDDLTKERKYSPFAFSHALIDGHKLYVPTRHYHDEERKFPHKESSSPMLPRWDHSIYLYHVGRAETQEMHDFARQGSMVQETYECHNTSGLIMLWPSTAPEITLPLTRQFHKINIRGRRPNRDFFLSTYPPPPEAEVSTLAAGAVVEQQQSYCVVS